MDKKKTLQMIADITNAPGTSGFEDAVVATARGYGEPYADLKEDSPAVSYTHLTLPTICSV